jgi:hypothetical protein
MNHFFYQIRKAKFVDGPIDYCEEALRSYQKCADILKLLMTQEMMSKKVKKELLATIKIEAAEILMWTQKYLKYCILLCDVVKYRGTFASEEITSELRDALILIRKSSDRYEMLNHLIKVTLPFYNNQFAFANLPT